MSFYRIQSILRLEVAEAISTSPVWQLPGWERSFRRRAARCRTDRTWGRAEYARNCHWLTNVVLPGQTACLPCALRRDLYFCEVKKMKKTPFLTLEKVKEITARIPTPFHLYDEAGIRANARALKEAFSWNKGCFDTTECQDPSHCTPGRRQHGGLCLHTSRDRQLAPE